MKKILVINPVSTDVWNDMVKNCLEEIKSPNVEFEIVNIKVGPTSIETFYAETFASPEILKIVDEYKANCDAIIINCSADPAVNAARELTDIPVVVPEEASTMIALMLGHKFGVIKPISRNCAMVELQTRNMGIEHRLAGVSAINIPVLELVSDLKKTARRLVDAAKDLIESKGAEVIILGCGSMVPAARIVKEEFKVPVIEPMTVAFKVAELMISLKLTHSKIGLYMTPDKGKIKSFFTENN